MRFPFSALFIFIFLPVLVFAQVNVGSISGKLIDGANSPVAYATVTLLHADSSVVNGDLSKDDGSFKIAPSGLGTFILRIESIGMTKKYLSVATTEADPDKKLGAIKLATEQTTLKEVSVVGEKRVMELKVDKKVFNVEKNITTAGGSATDVLQNVPSVSVDADGNVSLRGNSGVTILIDGKPATMFGADVNSALQSLPAGSIESVEVLTNPSAKYDAAGTGGIINIITKKDGHFGMNGSVTGGAGTNDKYNGNLSLNARQGKWNVFLNSSARQNHTYNNVITNRSDKLPDAIGDSMMLGHTHSYYTYEHVPRSFAGFFNTVGASFDPDKYNSITVTENINHMGFSFRDFSDYTQYNDLDKTGTTLLSRNRASNFAVNLFSISSAVDYKHKFKKKDEELSIDATYVTTDIRRSQHFTTNYYYPQSATSLNPIQENAPGSGATNSFNAWADYTDPLFTKNGKLGLGFKSQIYWFSTTSNPLIDTAHRGEKVDNTLLADYNYTQQIHAAYVNWNDQIGKFSYQLGLRWEDAIYDGTGKVPIDTTFHNSFSNFFPSAFISYQLPDQQSIYLNYSRRVNRPGFMQLLPFKDFSNPGTVSMGNPALLPEFINNIEFSYNKTDDKGNTFILSGYYAYTQNLIQRVTRPITGSHTDSALGLSGEVGSLLSQPTNIASGVTYGLEGTGRWQIMPIWDATLNVNFFQNELIIGSNSPYAKYISDSKGSSWFGKINTNLKLPKNFSLQINGNYESPKVIAQGSVEDSWWVDVAVKKNFWKNKASLVLNCSDIFNTHRFITNYNLSAYSEVINRVRETRIGNITFTYRFGKSDVGKSGQGAGRKEKMQDKNKPAKPSDEDRLKNLKENEDNDQPGGGTPGQGGGGRKEGGGK